MANYYSDHPEIEFHLESPIDEACCGLEGAQLRRKRPV